MQPSLTSQVGSALPADPGAPCRAARNVQREGPGCHRPCGLEPRVQFGERWFKEPGRRRAARPTAERRGTHERSGTHHRRGRRPAARPHRRPRAAPAAAALPRPDTDAFRNVAIAYGDDNPLWCDPDYGTGTRWGGPIASPVLVGGDTLIGEDEVTEVPAEHKDLMKGDPLRGVHAFYAASAREWWAPLRARPSRHPAQRAGRRARQAERVRRAGHARVDRPGVPRRRRRAAVGPVPADGPHRADQGPRAQEVRRHRDRAVHRRADRRDQRAVPRRAPPRRRAALVGGRRGGRRARPDGEGPADRHRHDLLARRHGHGPLRRRARCGSARRTASASPASSTATTSTSPT